MTIPTESTSAALARVTTERDRFIAAADKLHGEWLDLKAELATLASLAEGSRRTIAELADERDHARSERDALKSLYADAVNRLNTLTPEPPRLDCVICHPAD